MKRFAMTCYLREFWIFVIATFLLPWSQAPGAESDKKEPQKRGEAELLALHQADRVAHFKNRFAEYFQHADFSAWDDLQAPIVRVSEDGQLGWMAVRVRIAYTETNEKSQKVVNQSTMAWMSAYERLGGNWILT